MHGGTICPPGAAAPWEAAGKGRKRGGRRGTGIPVFFLSRFRPASPADPPPAGHTPPRVAPPGLWLLLMAPPRGLGRHPPPWFSWDLGVELPFAVFRSPGRFSPLPLPPTVWGLTFPARRTGSLEGRSSPWWHLAGAGQSDHFSLGRAESEVPLGHSGGEVGMSVRCVGLRLQIDVFPGGTSF